jgi:hypothetical protein
VRQQVQSGQFHDVDELLTKELDALEEKVGSRGGSRAAFATASRSWCLPDKPSLQDLLEAQRHFDLPSPALVEKDWYVVKALARGKGLST